MSTRFAKHGEGPFVTWKAATELLRWVHISVQFATDHPEINDIIRQTAMKKRSRWVIVDDLACFINMCTKKRTQHRRSEVIAFVVAEEAGVLNGYCSSFDLPVAFAAVQRIDRSASCTGMCHK